MDLTRILMGLKRNPICLSDDNSIYVLRASYFNCSTVMHFWTTFASQIPNAAGGVPRPSDEVVSTPGLVQSHAGHYVCSKRWNTKANEALKCETLGRVCQCSSSRHWHNSTGYSHKWITVVDQQCLAVITIAQSAESRACDITCARLKCTCWALDI